MENMRVKHLVSFLLFLSLTRICTPSPTADANQKNFVLVHGAGHGAWCWYKVSTLLTSIGHNVTALDLAASGVNPKQVQQLHSLSDYVEPLMRFMKSLPPKERVILVGHSMGGAALSISMEKFPEKIYIAVFATALMPGPALDYLNLTSQILNSLDLMDSQFRYDRGPNNPPTAALFGPKFLSSSMYQLSPPEAKKKGPNQEAQKKHFVLVHGAGHGAWCWYKLSALLISAGHHVTALDLAASGDNPKQINQVHCFADYVEPLIEFMESLPPEDRVILVGHSMGGASISIAMERFPEKISIAVFATAAMPGPTLSYLTIFKEVGSRLELKDSEYRYDKGPNKPPASAIFAPQRMTSVLYQLSPPEDLALALSSLRYFPLFDEEIKLTQEKYGLVRRVYIVCDQDLAIGEDTQRWIIKENPPHEVKVINGSDHTPMFSKPQEFFSTLQEISEKYS